MPKTEEETVTVFGEKIKNKNSKSGDGVVWGIMLILGGAVLLLNTLELLSWRVWDYMWKFWPVLLILAGLQIILGKSFFARIVMTIISICFLGLVILYGLTRVNPEIVKYLPSEIDWLFNLMKGVKV